VEAGRKALIVTRRDCRGVACVTLATYFTPGQTAQRKVQIPKKIFLIGGEKLSEEMKGKLNGLLEKYPSLKDFYWAKEKMRELYWQESKEEAAKVLDNIILNLKWADDGELIRWGNTLKHWREPILNYSDEIGAGN
jgi:hypothetical protein